ncbi:hypothetical protein [Streptomyces sp. B1I3]|uniref:hypothetical protein n=1 Tax=Streptomyces sp. B1I3 TaxID=3042264 RepID=UPI00278B0564|nr:hypothetical protein [Streptomyces sp. B1I3]MDQ0794892.1 hypothetical protein [Streptomyces sp. B1I3]
MTAHDAHYEIQARSERKAPLLSPDNPRERAREGGPGPVGGRPSREHPRRPRRGLRHRVGRLWRGR